VNNFDLIFITVVVRHTIEQFKLYARATKVAVPRARSVLPHTNCSSRRLPQPRANRRPLGGYFHRQ
jgi:hypothetical protein